MLLSIIVPVYQVKNYLRRCLESIVSQNFIDKELILIDDGSNDGSDQICDEFASKYDFIRVIHQENKGLAEVRNIGVKEANGEYISFIDSDDYILDGLYEYSFEIIKQNNVDVFCFGCINEYEGKPKRKIKQQIYTIKKFSAEEAIDQLLFSNNIDVITCNKIIKKDLFENIIYPKGKLYEDMFTTYKIIANANVIFSTNRPFYVYCHRKTSIGGRKFTSENYNLEKAAKENYEFAMKFCKNSQNAKIGYIFWRIVVANMMIRSGFNDYNYISETIKLCKENRTEIINNKLFSNTRKIQILIFGYFFNLYAILYTKIYKIAR